MNTSGLSSPAPPDRHVAARKQPARPAHNERLQLGARLRARPSHRRRGAGSFLNRCAASVAGYARSVRCIVDQICSANRGDDPLARREVLDASRSARPMPRDADTATPRRTPGRICRARTARRPRPKPSGSPAFRKSCESARWRTSRTPSCQGRCRTRRDPRRSPRAAAIFLADSRYRSRFASWMNCTSPKFVKPSPPTDRWRRRCRFPGDSPLGPRSRRRTRRWSTAAP